MPDTLPWAELISAFLQVVMIDLVLAGDNAIVIGMAAAGLHGRNRARAIFMGIAAATLLRIAFASIAIELLDILGLLLIGGILLLWVCWKMYREAVTSREAEADALEAIADGDEPAASAVRPEKSIRAAVLQIVLADVSMSLDNVLAVAGAARAHPVVLVFGLVLSIGLMGLAASFVARLLQRWHWLVWAGLIIILYVALDMVWRGGLEVWPLIAQSL